MAVNTSEPKKSHPTNHSKPDRVRGQSELKQKNAPRVKRGKMSVKQRSVFQVIYLVTKNCFFLLFS